MSKKHPFTITKLENGTLHIEAPGCIVNIRANLTTMEGQEVTRVDIRADHEIAGSPVWRMPDMAKLDPGAEFFVGVRVVQDIQHKAN